MTIREKYIVRNGETLVGKKIVKLTKVKIMRLEVELALRKLKGPWTRLVPVSVEREDKRDISEDSVVNYKKTIEYSLYPHKSKQKD